MGFFSAACFIYGIKYLPLSESITLMYTTPIFTGIIWWFLLNGIWTKREWLLTFISLLGVFMIVRPHAIFEPNDGQLNILGEQYTHGDRILGVIICLL